jgi:hypothetical protein
MVDSARDQLHEPKRAVALTTDQHTSCHGIRDLKEKIMTRTYAPCWTTRDADVAWFQSYDPNVIEVFIEFAFDHPGTVQSCWMTHRSPDGELVTPVRMTRHEELPPRYFIVAYQTPDNLKYQRDNFWGGVLVNLGFNPERRPAILLEGTDCDEGFFDAVTTLVRGLGYIDMSISGLFEPAFTEPGTEYFAIVLSEPSDPLSQLCARVHEELAQLKF